MCVAVPSKIIAIEDPRATVQVAGAQLACRLDLVPEARVGDYVLVHAGFALQVLDAEAATETLALLEEARQLA
ncbi:MAG: HypC/HybG/HupF family hydrogenase formation chaperone [candidate division WS1 bacterium]|jgi:hydrogenase expression/formation protein HypC|nr:HypC/HybG/HupF family hydrogenase formation chaperone [candidate division WS1 bacterium]